MLSDAGINPWDIGKDFMWLDNNYDEPTDQMNEIVMK